jgi:hypothetical protein
MIVLEQRLIELLADLLDNEGDWTFGCNNTMESRCIRHHRNETPLPGQQRVGPREWGETRLQYLRADDGAVLPDYLKPDVLPREAGGTLSYQEITDNIKKQARLPFTHTERREWLSNHGPAFHKMMTGDYGDGVQHLQFDIEDVCEQMDPNRRGKRSLFQSNDIDSGMGWLSSLGAIREDVKFFLYPFSSRNFDANIHLFMDIDDKRVRINEINHFLLGEFGNIGSRSCQLFLFLPSLYNPRSKGNGVKDHLKDAFISRCFIPAAEEILGKEKVGEFLKEQFGKGMREIKTDCEAPMHEGQIYGSAGNRLSGDVHVRQMFLARLWEECMTRLNRLLNDEDEDLLPFRGCRLFWSFKGFKYALAEVDDEELERTLETKVNGPFLHHELTLFQVKGMFDMSQIDEDEFHLDLGFMYGIPSEASDVPGDARIGYTTLPQECCLKDLVKRLNDLIPNAKGALKIKGTLYTWCLTKDVASLSIDVPPYHPLRELGLSYIQIYPSHKNLYDCQGHYPYPLDDDSGVCLATDSHGLKSLYSVVGRPVPDLGICRSSWRSSGGRIGVPLRSHSDRSFYTRMELRVTETLRRKIRIEIERRRQQRQAQPVEVVPPEAGCPFYIHTTEVINNFMTASTQVPARLFQEIISLAPEGHLSIDHQKLLVQIVQLQKVAHSAVLLPKIKYLYNSVVHVRPTWQEVEEGVDGPREEMGLGLKETIQCYGYGYPKHGLIDWVELNFANPHIAEQFPHPSHALSNITARPDDRQRLNDLFEEIDLVIGRLRMEQDGEKREVLLDWLVMRLIKQFHIDLTIYMIEGPYKFVNKEQHSSKFRDGNRVSHTSGNQRHRPVPQDVDNNRRRSTHRRRARGIEGTDTDYERHSSESEVGFPLVI